MTAIERFFQYIEEEKLNLSQLEKIHDIPSGHFNKIRNRKGGISEISLRYILKICPDLNFFWLITGHEESKYSKQKETSKEQVFQENIKLKKEVIELRNTIDTILKRKGIFSDKIEEIQMTIARHGDRISQLEDDQDVKSEDL